MKAIREILFRGKAENGEWVYGDYMHYASVAQIWRTHDRNDGTWNVIVKPETVGQFTGLIDKNGKKIFEGDLTRYDWSGETVMMSVIFRDGAFILHPVMKYAFRVWDIRISGESNKLDIIGNIHDNPELLKRGTKK